MFSGSPAIPTAERAWSIHQGLGYGVQAPGGHLLGAVGVNDHRASAKFGYQSGVFGVGPQVGKQEVRGVEAPDRQVRAADDPKFAGLEELARLVHRVAVLHLGFDEGGRAPRLRYQEILKRFKDEGYPLRGRDLGYPSPARHNHLNPYGRYRFHADEEENKGGSMPLFES